MTAPSARCHGMNNGYGNGNCSHCHCLPIPRETGGGSGKVVGLAAMRTKGHNSHELISGNPVHLVTVQGISIAVLSSLLWFSSDWARSCLPRVYAAAQGLAAFLCDYSQFPVLPRTLPLSLPSTLSDIQSYKDCKPFAGESLRSGERPTILWQPPPEALSSEVIYPSLLACKWEEWLFRSKCKDNSRNIKNLILTWTDVPLNPGCPAVCTLVCFISCASLPLLCNEGSGCIHLPHFSCVDSSEELYLFAFLCTCVPA